MEKKLVTVKQAHKLTGASESFFRKLLQSKELKTYKIHTSTYLSLVEFEQLAKAPS